MKASNKVVGGKKPYKIVSNIDKKCVWCQEVIPADFDRWVYPKVGEVHFECSSKNRQKLLDKQPKNKKKVKSKTSPEEYRSYGKKKNPFVANSNIRGWRDIK